MTDSLTDLTNAWVSIWLDDLSRDRLVTRTLADLAARDHVVGVTTNPTIFAKAISGSDTYGPQIRDLAAPGVGPTSGRRCPRTTCWARPTGRRSTCTRSSGTPSTTSSCASGSP